jgi:hypothetical protein
MNIENYNGKQFRIQVQVTVEDETHMQDVAKLRGLYHGKRQLDKGPAGAQQFIDMISNIEKAEKNLPEICDLCKKEHTARAFTEGKFLDVEHSFYTRVDLAPESWDDISRDLGNMDVYRPKPRPNNDDEPPTSRGRIGFN